MVSTRGAAAVFRGFAACVTIPNSFPCAADGTCSTDTSIDDNIYVCVSGTCIAISNAANADESIFCNGEGFEGVRAPKCEPPSGHRLLGPARHSRSMRRGRRERVQLQRVLRARDVRAR
jgi:hypothetical protein